MKRHVVIAGTVYPLLLYMLHKAELPENIQTVYFIDEKLSAFAGRIPNVIVVRNFRIYKNVFLRKISEFFWVVSLRFKRTTVWRRHFRDAEIFAQDHFNFSSMLIGGQDYNYISDGFNDFSAYMRTEIFRDTWNWRQNNSLKHSLLKWFCGPTWMGWFCLNDQCTGVLHENPQPIPYARRELALRKVDMQKIWHNIDDSRKEEICRYFNITADEAGQLSAYPVVLLAQSFESTGDLTTEELVGIYRKALADFDESQVMIKTHQFGRIRYKKYFPRAFVFEKTVPMQLLVLLGGGNIKTAITINSTAVSLFGDAVKIIWLGEKVHPKLLARYGDNTMDEIVHRS